MTTLSISASHYQMILTHLASVYPMEGCGLLGGKDGRIQCHYPIKNQLNSPVAFDMDPQQLVAAITDIEARGLSLAAIYHSHPRGPAKPSPTDISQAYYPDAVQIIVSFDDPEQPIGKAFQIIDGQVTEVTLKIV
jgi:proteasome lid subunit RPN8/RPN11